MRQGRHRPLTLAVAGQLVQADRLQRAEVVEGGGGVQSRQQILGLFDVGPGKLAASSANRRVALFAQDLIILAKYEALYVNEWRAQGASSTPTPRSPETPPAAPCMRNRNHRANRAIGNGRGHKFAK